MVSFNADKEVIVMTRTMRRVVRTVLLAALSLAGVFAIVASNGGGGGQQTNPPTVGSISVTMGFGAVSSTPYQCTGGGTITITPQNLTGTAGKNQPESKSFSYSGFSSTTPNQPACQTTVIFPDLRPGSWRVSAGAAACPATVNAGAIASVRIVNGVCQ
jgi:hypothetical protein